MSKQKTGTNWAEVTPYSWKLRRIFDGKLVDVSFTQTQILNKIMSLAVKREQENQFTDTITKDVYFRVLHDVILNTLFENDYNLNKNK